MSGFGAFDRQGDLFSESPQQEMTWREKYNAVLSSSRWKRIRQRFISKSGGKCGRCGWSKSSINKTKTLDLHHKTYERLGEEIDDDLELVCSECHAKADAERAAEGRKRAADALHDARFHGWASKVYGDNYEMFVDDFAYDSFCGWIDRKQDDWN